MKFCAIICEFNPLHNGHKHIIEQAKAKTGLPVLCLLSGNFCQRAQPTVAEKHIRAQWATHAGADVVFELPTIFATGSARDFASGAIHVLTHLPVEYLVFGAECGNLENLILAKDFLKKLDNSADLKNVLKSGENYKTAICEVAKQKDKKTYELLQKPNNILAIEYLRALEKTNITPIVVLREDNFLDVAPKTFCSSSSLRNAQQQNKLSNFEQFAPIEVLNDLQTKKDFSNICEHIFFALKTTTAEKLANCPSCTFDLRFRILKHASMCKTFDDFLEQCTTKRYSKIRICRVALENFFGITKELMQQAHNLVPTITLLARRDNLHFDGFFDKTINLVLKKSDLKKYQNEPTLKIDLLAQKLYER